MLNIYCNANGYTHTIIIFNAIKYRKFLEAKVQGMKELEDTKLLYRDNALRDAREAMDSQSKKLVIENKRISEELKFHSTISYEFQVSHFQYVLRSHQFS
jgi:hypothetical protein